MPFISGKTVSEIFLKRVNATPNTVGFSYHPSGMGQWKDATFREFYDECRLISLGLTALGARPGDKIAIFSNTRYEWQLCDMAILGASCVTVPIYPSSNPADVQYILNHSEARFLFVEDARQLEKLGPEASLGINGIFAFDAVSVAQSPPRKEVMSLQALREIGKREEMREPLGFDQRLGAAKPSDIATLCYTSGTSGMPKGAMITHDNVASVVEDVIASLSKYLKPEGEKLVTFLPLSHILGKVESICTYAFGWQSCFVESFDALGAALQEVKPTLLFAVPRVFEKAYQKIQLGLQEASPSQRKLFDWALKAGRRYFELKGKPGFPPIREYAEYSAAHATVLRKVMGRLGGKLRVAISGGAPLPAELADFFKILGLPILEGYGLTETCGPVAVNTPDLWKIGSVGRPLPDVQVRIDEDGEILIKSRKVFAGYFKMPEETAEAFSSAWFKTGDIGHLDSEGYLHITDRKKDLIITSAGKNIAPQKIENLFLSQKFVGPVVVVGDRKNYLSALITLDREQIIRYSSENNILFSDFQGLVTHSKINSLIQKVIDDVNAQLGSFETIKKFVILAQEFSVASGELTPSLKVKRAFVRQKFKESIDSMYA